MIPACFARNSLLLSHLMFRKIRRLPPCDSTLEQVEGLFSLPEILFSHDQIVMTMGLSLMLRMIPACFARNSLLLSHLMFLKIRRLPPYDSTLEQVGVLFCLSEILFSRDQIVMTIGLCVMLLMIPACFARNSATPSSDVPQDQEATTI